MNPSTHPRHVLLTGATGGIGRAIALELARQGDALALVGRSVDALLELQREIEAAGGRAVTLRADLGDPADVRTLGARAVDALGALDAVIHCAGVSRFTVAEDEAPEDVARQFQVNAIAPIQITESLLPRLKETGGTIVQVGSVFGAIGFAHFATYSATKFAVRGYAEALRRELAGSKVNVVHVAPRATRTAMTASYADMADAVGMKLDPPEKVASAVARALERGTKESVVGFPERFFVRLNALLPRFVDRALRGQNVKARPFAVGQASPPAPPAPRANGGKDRKAPALDALDAKVARS